MSAPAKRRSVQPNENGQEDNVEGMIFNLDFEGRNPESTDFHSVKQLLQQLFLKAHVNLSDMAELLIHQKGIGTVIKQVCDDENYDDDDDDDDVDENQGFGITTILNLTDKEVECVEQLHKLLLELSKEHGDANTSEFIENLLNDDKKPVALLINERYINIPPPISVPLFQSVSKEMAKLKSKHPSNDFVYLIMICKLYKTKNSKKGNKKNETEIIWSNAEEEIFDEEAEYKFEFSVQNERASGLAGKWEADDSEMIPYRRVLIFPAHKFDLIVNKVQSVLNNAL